jgi:hypothetical protein
MAVLSNAFTIGVGSSTVRMETAHENYAVAGIEHCLPLGLPHSALGSMAFVSIGLYLGPRAVKFT